MTEPADPLLTEVRTIRQLLFAISIGVAALPPAVMLAAYMISIHIDSLGR
jgi:hypothetical protein